jgi:hypothetical protein
MKRMGLRSKLLAACSVVVVVSGCAAGQAVTASSSPPPTLDTPAGTSVVARLQVEPYAGFSWSPDGAHILVGNQDGSTVYDRHGRKVSEYRGQVGWADESHLLSPDGSIHSIAESQGLGSMSNAWVVANGHGTAMVVVAVPGCVGDPEIAWYRNGSLDLEHRESLTPIGWSADGSLALEGHMTCGAMDGELRGWKGDVTVVDIATGETKVTLHDVRGELAFSPGGKLLAAQSDTDVEVADIDAGTVSVAGNARLLAWTTARTLALRAGETLELAELLDQLKVTTPEPSEILMPSPIDGVALGVDVKGNALGIEGPETGPLGLTDQDLAIDANPQPAADEWVGTWLQPNYWSPDGRMLVLPAIDRQTLVLLSVNPGQLVGSSPSN